MKVKQKLLRKLNHVFGYWCQYGAQLGISYFMSLMYEYHSKEMFGAVDAQKAFYWLKKAAENGEKDCCQELGNIYLELEETDLGIKLLMQGYEEFGDEDCLETLKELATV